MSEAGSGPCQQFATFPWPRRVSAAAGHGSSGSTDPDHPACGKGGPQQRWEGEDRPLVNTGPQLQIVIQGDGSIRRDRGPPAAPAHHPAVGAEACGGSAETATGVGGGRPSMRIW